MKVSSYVHRIGGFVSSNTGSVTDCCVDAKVRFKEHAAGFAFENSGKITRCIARKPAKGKSDVAGFCLRNRGTVACSGFLRPEGKTPESKKKTPPKKTLLADEALAVSYRELKDVYEKLSLSEPWILPTEGDRRLGFSDAAPESASEEAIEISSVQQLFSITSDIASGDAQAAGSDYVLTQDLNLGGKTWIPMGLTDAVPFSGTFRGNGHKIYNFKIRAKDLVWAGFFGYVKGGEVTDLSIDCVVHAAGGTIVGAMCAQSEHGVFRNCRVAAKVLAQKTCGGFCGKNSGRIERCSFAGSVTPAVPPLFLLLPIFLASGALLTTGLVIMLIQLGKEPYTPEVLDPNQRPVINTEPITPPPAGSSRISIECNQDVYLNVATQVGEINYVNPHRSSLDVMIKVLVSDDVLMKTLGKTGRSAKDQAALEAKEGYDPKTTYQELYASGRLQIGYKLELIKLNPLPDGTALPLGDYEMMVAIDAYDPQTYEKAVVNARAPITVHVVKSEENG